MHFKEFLNYVFFLDKKTGKEIKLSEKDKERMSKMHQELIDNASSDVILLKARQLA